MKTNINTRSVHAARTYMWIYRSRRKPCGLKRQKREERSSLEGLRQCDSVERRGREGATFPAAHRLLGWNRRWRLEKIPRLEVLRESSSGYGRDERRRDNHPRDAGGNEDRRIKASWLSDELTFCQSSRAHSSVSESRVENLTFSLCSVCRKSNSYYRVITLFKEEFVSELKTFQQVDAIVEQSENVIPRLKP